MSVSVSLYLWQAVAVGLAILPLVIAIGYAVAWRKVIVRPISFVVVGTSCLFLAYLLLGELLFVPALDAFMFVPSTPREGARSLTPFFAELAPTPLALLLIAYPILRWLRGLLPKKEPA